VEIKQVLTTYNIFEKKNNSEINIELKFYKKEKILVTENNLIKIFRMILLHLMI